MPPIIEMGPSSAISGAPSAHDSPSGKANPFKVPVAPSALIVVPQHMYTPCAFFPPEVIKEELPTVHPPHLVLSSKDAPEAEVDQGLKDRDNVESHKAQLAHMRRGWQMLTPELKRLALDVISRHLGSFADGIGSDLCNPGEDHLEALEKDQHGRPIFTKGDHGPVSAKAAFLDFLVPDASFYFEGSKPYEKRVEYDGKPQPALAATIGELLKDACPLKYILQGSMQPGGVTADDVGRTCKAGLDMKGQKKPGCFMVFCKGEAEIGIALSCDKMQQYLMAENGTASGGDDPDIEGFMVRHKDDPTLQIKKVYSPPAGAPWSTMRVVQTVIKVLLKTLSPLNQAQRSCITLNNIQSPMLVRHFRWCWLTLYQFMLDNFEDSKKMVPGPPILPRADRIKRDEYELGDNKKRIDFLAALWQDAIADSGMPAADFVLSFWYLYYNRSQFPFVLALFDRYTFLRDKFAHRRIHVIEDDPYWADAPWDEDSSGEDEPLSPGQTDDLNAMFTAASTPSSRVPNVDDMAADIVLFEDIYKRIGQEQEMAHGRDPRILAFEARTAFWVELLTTGRRNTPHMDDARETLVPVNLYDRTADHDEDPRDDWHYEQERQIQDEYEDSEGSE